MRLRLSRLLPTALLALASLAPPAGAGSAQGSASLRSGTLTWGVAEGAAGSELWLRVDSPARRIELPAPGGRVAARRAEPLPFSSGGDLTGLAWLEGDAPQRYTVRFAPWTGEGWGAVEQVAGVGAGSQLALAGARLADGRALLVWAAFDGEDDEILYSLRSDRGWSAPERVDADDSYPDITPAVVAADEGALVAWSGFDGDQYRVVVARFDGERFRPARAVGAAGTVFPALRSEAGVSLLVYRDARRRGWTIAELDRSGAPKRTAFVAGDEREAPQVERRGDALRLRWALTEKEAHWQ